MAEPEPDPLVLDTCDTWANFRNASWPKLRRILIACPPSQLEPHVCIRNRGKPSEEFEFDGIFSYLEQWLVDTSHERCLAILHQEPKAGRRSKDESWLEATEAFMLYLFEKLLGLEPGFEMFSRLQYPLEPNNVAPQVESLVKAFGTPTSFHYAYQWPTLFPGFQGLISHGNTYHFSFVAEFPQTCSPSLNILMPRACACTPESIVPAALDCMLEFLKPFVGSIDLQADAPRLR